MRPDCIIATGRSDYPNQVNNVLCFPYIFRGALDCGATKITEEMKLACVREIAELAKADISDEVATAYAGQGAALRARLPDPHAVRFAPDPAHRAGRGEGGGRASGVATRPIDDIEAYRQHADALRLPHRHVHAPGVQRRASRPRKRVAYAEGEDERVLRAVQLALDERLVKPILIGRPAVIEARIEKAGLRLQAGRGLRDRQPRRRPALPPVLGDLPPLMGRDGVTPETAKAAVRRSNTTDRRADGAPGRRRRACCAAWSAASTATWSTCTNVIGLTRGRAAASRR